MSEQSGQPDKYFSISRSNPGSARRCRTFVAFFIIVTTAATLNANGVTKIDTRRSRGGAAADRGRPDVLPVRLGDYRHRPACRAGAGRPQRLCGGEAFGLRGSLSSGEPRDRVLFDCRAATLGGAALAATSIDPIAMLFWTAVINGSSRCRSLVAMMWIVSSKKGGVAITLPRWIKLLGWLAER